MPLKPIVEQVTFDHVLVDFFYVDRLLRPGGIVMLDDVGYPSIHAVIRFVLSNRDYELVDVAPASLLRAASILRFKRAIKAILHPIARTDLDPYGEHRRLFRRLDSAQAVALRLSHSGKLATTIAGRSLRFVLSGR